MSKYIVSLRNRLKFSHGLASKHIQASREKQKRNYDVKKSSILNPVDLVLVKIVAFDARHKLLDKLESESPMLYCLNLMRVSQFIKVQKQSGFGKPRVLHRKLFLPIGSSNIDKPKPVPEKTVLKTKKSSLIQQQILHLTSDPL